MSEDIIWGVELSCFTLKVQACLQHAHRPYRRLPDQGTYLENTKIMLSLEYAKHKKLVTRFPSFEEDLDEYPAVPYHSKDGKHFQYDSSSIASWLDSINQGQHSNLFPKDNLMNFVACLIDEAFDEFGLYLVHHMRWVGSAKSNVMGKLLGKEYRHALPPGGRRLLSKHFPKRQVRRCPYLFSVSPIQYHSGMSKELTPPSREGFPETHNLLNESWVQYLKGMEAILSEQPYLLGHQFTIADASAYGQLGMNLVDPEAAEKIRQIAPITFKWLNNIYQGKHIKHANDEDHKLYLNDALKPLLNTIMSTFSALMIQNSQAYEMAKKNNITIFNEAAFNQGIALYDGQLRGYPFRSVVKTFQVRTWKALCDKWAMLSKSEQTELKEMIQMCEMFSA